MKVENERDAMCDRDFLELSTPPGLWNSAVKTLGIEAARLMFSRAWLRGGLAVIEALGTPSKR